MKTFKKLTLVVGFGFVIGSFVIAAPIPIKISNARVDAQIKSINTRDIQVTNEIRQKVLFHMQQTEALKNEAIAQGIDKMPDYLVNLENMKSSLLARELVFDFNKKHPVTPTEIRDAYKKMLADNSNRKSYLVQHILCKTEVEAKQVIVDLGKGKSFATLVKKSIDYGSKEKSGSLGWVTVDELDPAFAAAMIHLSKGQVSAKPVHSSYGWHVIKLDDVRQEKTPTLAESTKVLKRQIMQERIKKYIDSILSRAGVPEK